MANLEPRRLFFYATLAAAGAAMVYFIGSSLSRGERADRCAEELARAAVAHDAAYVERAVRTPSARDALLGAAHVEVGFVRPVSSKWSRVGLFVKKTATSTSMEAVVLQLSMDPTERCLFLRDYEDGAFTSGAAEPVRTTTTSTAPR
ncbi:hypothetical protein L6R52_38955 [Myxococcota bacterium]|nr:hypothetical protein [Myxococcota bacterium]